jgi:hypothetical protein
MDSDAALLAIQRDVGELRGEMTGIGREIGDIKRLLECKTNDCRACRDGIDQDLLAQADLINARIDKQAAKIAPITEQHAGEKAVSTWKEKAIAGGSALGVFAFAAWIGRGIMTGDWT